MFPENDALEKVFFGVMTYIGERWYAIGIFSLLFFWAWHLYHEFHKRATCYNKQAPKEALLLNLQCRRWERYVHQVMVGIGLSIGISFILYLVVELTKDVALAAGDTSRILPEGVRVEYAEALFFVFLFSIKVRALWDAKGVHSDLRKCDL